MKINRIFLWLFLITTPLFIDAQTNTTNTIIQNALIDSAEAATLIDNIFNNAETASPTSERNALDTINTPDKFTKIILYDDFTWAFFDTGRPIINDSLIMDSSWSNSTIHSYKNLTLSMLPEEIDLLLVDSLHPFFPPASSRKINSSFRFRGSRPHEGVDIKVETGDSICSCFDGVVRVVKPSRQTGGYGNLVVIRHANGLETYYAHLSQILVSENETVKAGELIGLGGCTGRCTGSHLHFETRYMGKFFDPERIINFETGTLRDTMFTLKKHYFSIYSHYGQTDKQSQAASARQYYTIKSGDTLSSIAKRWGTTIDRLCQWNNITRNTTLRVGRKIVVRE